MLLLQLDDVINAQLYRTATAFDLAPLYRYTCTMVLQYGILRNIAIHRTPRNRLLGQCKLVNRRAPESLAARDSTTLVPSLVTYFVAETPKLRLKH